MSYYDEEPETTDRGDTVTRLLRWIGDHFPALLMFGLAFWALAVDEIESARYMVTLAVLFGISQQISNLRDEIRANRKPIEESR